ncbi:hypothetical protein [Singulisphaera sp. PoT]|uniref:hypothetical protein n=1 Tax=Singulisphaera sp. PoT TaxID=3411797 RepID=UPI003BF4D3F8
MITFNAQHWDPVARRWLALEVECEVEPYDPGRRSGPPESCYPAEGGTVTELSVKVLGVRLLDRLGNVEHALRVEDGTLSAGAAIALAREFEARLEPGSRVCNEVDRLCFNQAAANSRGNDV